METTDLSGQDETLWVLPGYRLERLELLNWGTFHGEGQVLAPRGAWSLVVGDNGSGKSTAIDALRTLLVPPRLLNYNDASGDGRKTSGRDRTRRSYVRGAWASSSTVDSTTPTTQYLREAGVLSAISAVFRDAPRSESVTVAQVLWEHDEAIRELFAIHRTSRGLRDLLGRHTNTTEIKRAAKQAGWEVYENFSSYSERMRKLLHIPGEKALEVFNRAIGMKEVGDIDAFVRQFLLPSADTFTFIRDTIQPHYKTLMDCWAAIDRAERQMAALQPVLENAHRISAAEEKIGEWQELQNALKPYFLTRFLGFLADRAQDLGRQHEVAHAHRSAAESHLNQRRSERDNLIAAISSTDVGPRLQSLEREIQLSEDARKRAQALRSRIQPSISLLNAETALAEETSFLHSRPQWEAMEAQESMTASKQEEHRAECRHRQELALKSAIDVREEIESTERNRVNIPRQYLGIRERLCDVLRVDNITMPFAGELIEVKDEYADWAGAIERLLRSFGLALLVPDDFYRPAAEFINSTMLGLRLTFHAVPARVPVPPPSSAELVPGRLSYRANHPLHSWVMTELSRRFNYRCCQTIAELERVEKGITREGLMRERSRHVKDDQRPIDDLGNRILGWSTERKLAALRVQFADLEKQASAAGRDGKQAGQAAESARARAAAARELLNIPQFLDLHPAHWSDRLVRLKTEKDLIEGSSQELHRLRQRKTHVESEIDSLDKQVREADGEVRLLEKELSVCETTARNRGSQLKEFASYDHAKTESDFVGLLGPHAALTMENPDQLMNSASQSIQGRINNEQGKVKDATGKLTAAMTNFLKEFGEYAQTLLPETAYADGFLAVHRRIEEEDLPRHRERFEHYLNENLVGDLLMLRSRLEQHEQAIEARVEEINQALRTIAYSESTYVQLHLARRLAAQVSEFNRSLRECFEHGIHPGPAERMKIFLRVRTLLEKFQADAEATQRVTDVRTWYSAGVRELRHADDSEANFYAATTGKSGGQKAKLAFTILASALTAQYGLSQAEPDRANFRLVVIDEAFSRTDEQNSQRAMQLFASLGFQVVIVGPFDAKAKLAVPFVGTIHLASNPAGNTSQLVAITRQDLESRELVGLH